MHDGTGIGRIVHSIRRGNMVKVKHIGIIMVLNVSKERMMGKLKDLFLMNDIEVDEEES